MTGFRGIWKTDAKQLESELTKQVLGQNRIDPLFGDPGLKCHFLGEKYVVFPGMDVIFHDITLEDDLSDFHDEQIEDGYWKERTHVARNFEYKITDGCLYLKSMDVAEAPWRSMPFRYEGDRSFLIKPLGYFQRMLPVTLEQLDSTGDEFGPIARTSIENAARHGAPFSPDHHIPEGLVDAPDDAVGFDPTDDPDDLDDQ